MIKQENTMEAINVLEKFKKITKYWHPYIIGEMNDNYIRLAKMKDEFVWHKYDNEDELFIIFGGTMLMELRDKTIEVNTGEIIVIPKGVEHRPRTNGSEVLNMLIEPKSTKHTGDVESEITVKSIEWI